MSVSLSLLFLFAFNTLQFRVQITLLTSECGIQCNLQVHLSSFTQIGTFKLDQLFSLNQKPFYFISFHSLHFREAIDRVKRGHFALLMESSSIEYQVKRNCDLIQVGGLLEHVSYAIATPATSPYTNVLSWAILHLGSTGKLSQLKNRWWGYENKSNNNNNNNHQAQTHPFSETNCALHSPMDSMVGHKLTQMGEIGGGIFLLLLAGSLIACCVVIMELIWKTKKVPRVSGLFTCN